MKIIIPTIGTRGDVQPYIALALGLTQSGHSVTLATHPTMRGLVESYGVSFAPIGPDIDIGHEAAVIRGHSPNWMIGFMRVMKFTFAMLEFLEAGEPPLVVSLGAMALSGEDALEAAQITLAAIQQAGVRAIIQGWDEPLKQLTLPPAVFKAGAIPHDWLLERAGGLVHHGGFGTTSAGLRAGIPSLVIPHIIDQFIWGQKVAELGVGPKPISRAKLKIQDMADALVQMKAPTMRAKAAALGEKIRQEDGVAAAVQLINK